MQDGKRKNLPSSGRKDTTDRMPPLQEPDGLPGGRAALPANSLSKPFFGPQGDENRTPPQNAPSPVKPPVRVRPDAGQ
jgi:hypothetical protein